MHFLMQFILYNMYSIRKKFSLWYALYSKKLYKVKKYERGNCKETENELSMNGKSPAERCVQEIFSPLTWLEGKFSFFAINEKKKIENGIFINQLIELLGSLFVLSFSYRKT